MNRVGRIVERRRSERQARRRGRLLFDAAFYRILNPSIAHLPDDALFTQFLDEGWRQGADPAPDFSVAGYLRINDDVAAAGANPFLHYLAFGVSEERAAVLSDWGRPRSVSYTPHDLALIEPHVVRDHIVAERPQLSTLSDRAVAAWYLVVGWAEGLDPSPDLSIRAVQARHDGDAARGRNPLLAELAARPAAPDPSGTHAYRRVGERFDPDFYRAAYADVAGFSDTEALDHFMRYGWREGRDPRPGFSTRAYLAARPDLQGTDINPFLDHIESGHATPAPRAPGLLQAPPLEIQPPAPADLDAVRDSFDADWYRATYPDVEGDDEALMAHYMTEGWRQRRDPSPHFSTGDYLDLYADIDGSGSNPLLHYVLFGRYEGRRPKDGHAQPLIRDPAASGFSGLPATVLADAPADPPAPHDDHDPASLRLHWVIPDFTPGGGGHATIFRMIRHLEAAGHRCTIWIEAQDHHVDATSAWEDIVKHFVCVRADVAFLADGFFAARGDIAIATGWSTAFAVQQAKGFAARCYFVQDHEPDFYPAGAESLLARDTYDFEMGCICASPWLEALMRDRYGRWARSFHLSVDREVYRIADPAAQEAKFAPDPTGPIKLAVYARAHTPRRCVPLTLAALEILGRRGAAIEVHFFGQADLPLRQVNFEAINHGVLPPERLAELYNACDIGVCLSATNYSLVPTEMMACGLALVELDTESTRAIFDPAAVTLAGPQPRDIADRIEALIADPAARRAQVEAGLDWASRFTWEAAGDTIEGALRDYLLHRGARPAAPATRTKTGALMDVVIPTWNGIDELPPVIEALRGQSIAGDLRLICIDSSSTDGTTEWLRDQPDIDLTVIPQAEFQHGRTRNVAAGEGDAPVIAFLTQDAIPATRRWAEDILRMMDHVPEAAGLFGRHIAHPHHPDHVRQEIRDHFDNLARFPLALSRDTDPGKWASGDRGWRQVLHFYSDNNSAMRRSVWERHPYPEIPYGEDQVWARDIIEAGRVKLYAPTAAVYHSHDYTPEETFARARTESGFFLEHFGYVLGVDDEAEMEEAIAREQSLYRHWARSRKVDADEFARRLANIDAKYRGWREGRVGG